MELPLVGELTQQKLIYGALAVLYLAKRWHGRGKRRAQAAARTVFMRELHAMVKERGWTIRFGPTLQSERKLVDTEWLQLSLPQYAQSLTTRPTWTVRPDGDPPAWELEEGEFEFDSGSGTERNINVRRVVIFDAPVPTSAVLRVVPPQDVKRIGQTLTELRLRRTGNVFYNDGLPSSVHLTDVVTRFRPVPLGSTGGNYVALTGAGAEPLVEPLRAALGAWAAAGGGALDVVYAEGRLVVRHDRRIETADLLERFVTLGCALREAATSLGEGATIAGASGAGPV